MLALRDYQEEALNAINAARARGITKQLVVLPTGTGKTVIMAALVAKLAARTLILVHRDELIGQTIDKLNIAWPESLLKVGVVKAERNEVDREVIIASVQTVSLPKRLAQLARNFDLVLTDEAHHAVAPQWRTVLAHIGAGEERRLHVGWTATPNRADHVGLRRVFDEVVYHRTITEMVRAGYLAPPRGVTVRTSVDLSRLSDVAERAGDFNDAQLETVLNTANRNQLIVDAYKRYAVGRKALVFAAGVKHAHDLSEAFRAAGVASAALDGSTVSPLRRQIEQDFRQGRLQVLVNCNVLTEGYDEPSITCILLARPTMSHTFYVQMVGRGLRTYPGKTDCLVIDVADNAGRHRLIQLPDLMGDPASRSRGGPRAQRSDGEPAEDTGVGGEGKGLIGEEVTLLTTFQWVQVGGAWLLSLPERQALALLQRPGNMYSPVLLLPDRHQPLHLGTLPLEWAQGVAEGKAREMLGGKLTLIDREASWRAKPVSDGQKEILRKLSVSPEGMTRGEASDIITAANWNRRLVSLKEVPRKEDTHARDRSRNSEHPAGT